jgi:hypothetical protein
MTGEPTYRAYVLRLWTADGAGAWIWHASLEEIHGPDRRVFGDVDDLCCFLRTVTGQAPADPAPTAQVAATPVPPVQDIP